MHIIWNVLPRDTEDFFFSWMLSSFTRICLWVDGCRFYFPGAQWALLLCRFWSLIFEYFLGLVLFRAAFAKWQVGEAESKVRQKKKARTEARLWCTFKEEAGLRLWQRRESSIYTIKCTVAEMIAVGQRWDQFSRERL